MPRDRRQPGSVATSDLTRCRKTLSEITRPIESIVVLLDDDAHRVHDQRQSFQPGPDFGVTSANYDFAGLLRRAEAPR